MMKISEISKKTNIPASTIRVYERFHFIEPVKRQNNGYRVFNDRHIFQLKICRLVLRVFVNKNIRKISLQIIEAAVKWDIIQCRKNTEIYIQLILDEINKAYAAFESIQNWRTTSDETLPAGYYNAKQAAYIIGVTKETIRNWERNGLLFNHLKKYEKRKYSAHDISCMRINYMLRQVGYGINIILRFMEALEHDDPLSMRILIEPDRDEDLNEVYDRWLQHLFTAKQYGMDVLSVIDGIKTL